jgi:[ribosomal protein S5]-alanine N-acetyltransferase
MREGIRATRLIGWPLVERDAECLCRMHADPKVMANLGGVRSEFESASWLQSNLDHWDRHGFGIWVFRFESNQLFVGRGGLRCVAVNGASEVELNCALLAQYWGKGLATEMARAVLTWGFYRHEMETVIILVDSANVASRRVAEKLGFRFETNVTWKSLPTMLYRLRRIEFS